MTDLDTGLRNIAEIRSIMERSTKFLSLSGFAGIGAGIVALAGAWIARGIIAADGVVLDAGTTGATLAASARTNLVMLGVGSLLCALAIAWFFSRRVVRRQGGSGPAARYLILALAVPVVVGAMMTLLLLYHGVLWLVAPTMLLFYGLGLFSAGTFTFGEIRALGILQILLGLVAAIAPGYGLILWATGFGLFHIVYGILFFRKYRQ